MKRKKLPILLLSAVLLTGCAGSNQPAPATDATTATETAGESTTAEIIQNSVGTAQETEVSETAAETDINPYAGLTLNQYENLEMTAAILPRNAIIPGMTVPVTIVISNNGDQTISYVQGSGSFSTPQSLHLEIEGLQPILPMDHLGAATMDYVMKELKPGESLTFTMNVRTVEPNENFDNYTYDLYNKEQVYIGDLEPDKLLTAYDDLKGAAAGAYEGTATFVYYLAEEAENTNVFGEATGYIQAPVTISVTE